MVAERIRPDIGKAAEARFAHEMERWGYEVQPYAVYDHIERVGNPRRTQRLRDGLARGYSPTAHFLRAHPDFIVIQPDGVTWLADVKSASKIYANTALEATQLMLLHLLAEQMWVDVRYVYVPDDGPMRCAPATEVFKAVSVVYVDPSHASLETYQRLRAMCGVVWDERLSTSGYDPFVLLSPDMVRRWRPLGNVSWAARMGAQ